MRTLDPKNVSNEFDEWSRQGRGPRMAEGHRPLVEFILKRWNLESSMSLLDIGCGVGDPLKQAASEFGLSALTGIDISEDMIARAKEYFPEGKFQCARAEALPFEEGSFDAVLSIESIYYHERPEQTLEEVFRVLKPLGRFGIAIEFYKENKGSHSWSKVLDLDMHLKSESEWISIFENAGFAAVQADRIRHIDPIPQEEYEDKVHFENYEAYLEYANAGALFVEGTKN